MRGPLRQRSGETPVPVRDRGRTASVFSSFGALGLVGLIWRGPLQAAHKLQGRRGGH